MTPDSALDPRMVPPADWSEPLLRAKAALKACEEELRFGRYVGAHMLLGRTVVELDNVAGAILERVQDGGTKLNQKDRHVET
jgi:hypothetical protein